MPSINLGKVVGTVDANTPITFEDYTSTTAPEPEEALSKITSPNTIGNLFKYIKGFLSNVIHKNNIVNNTTTNDSTKIPSSAVTYDLQEQISNLNETKVDKTSIVHNADVTDTTKVPGMDLIHNMQEQITKQNNNLENHFMSGSVTTSFDLDFTNSKNTMHYIFTQYEIIAVARYSSSVFTYKLVTSTIRPLTITVDGYKVHMDSPNGSVWLSMITIVV